jgi:hypothetical protein
MYQDHKPLISGTTGKKKINSSRLRENRVDDREKNTMVKAKLSSPKTSER